MVGKVGYHQVPLVRNDLAYNDGNCSQYYSMWIANADKQEKIHERTNA